MLFVQAVCELKSIGRHFLLLFPTHTP